MTSELIERWERWLQNTGYDGGVNSPAMLVLQRMKSDADAIERLTARAEAAEARVKVLEELLEAYDDATPEHDDRCSVGALYNCTCDLQDVKVRARAALGGEHDK